MHGFGTVSSAARFCRGHDELRNLLRAIIGADRPGQMILADPTASGQTDEVYLFMLVVYFVIGSAITLGAPQIEARLRRSAH